MDGIKINPAESKPSELARYLVLYHRVDDAAKAAGVSRRTYYNWLAGEADHTTKPYSRGLVQLRRVVAKMQGDRVPGLPKF